MAEIYLYGIVGDSWDSLDAAYLVPLIGEGSDDLDLRINSPGGYVIEGLAIYNALIRARDNGRKITCHIDGLAASMASVIAMAGTEIVMADNALMMIHNPWDCACGDASELRRAADQLDRLKAQIVGIYARQTGLDADALGAMMDDETWLDSAGALAQNFATTIASSGSSSASNMVRPSNIQPFGFRKAPEHPLCALTAQTRTTRTARPRDPAATLVNPKGKSMTDEEKAAAAAAAAAAAKIEASAGILVTAPAALTTVDVQNAVADERSRVAGIRALGTKHKLDGAAIDAMLADGTSLPQARENVLDQLATASDAVKTGGPSITIGRDERDKWVDGATNWLLIRSGAQAIVEAAAKARGETLRLDPGEFRGITPLDLARESLQHAGVRNISRDPNAMLGSAFTARNEVTQGAGDFTVALENTMHKTLQAAYQITPDTWSAFCGKGTVTDFRPSNRYLRGTFGALDSLNDLGEFKNKGIPDAEKQTISAGTKGNIISLSRQAIINDDLGYFVGLASDLGRAAKLSIEIDVYNLLIANPNTYDGNALFSTAHKNLAGSLTLADGTVIAVGTIGVANLDLARVSMANQKDPSGNEILDIRPQVLLVPLKNEGSAKVLIGSPYDPDATNKLQRPNMVQGLVGAVVGSARLTTGTGNVGWYFFADKDMAPAIEVVFLNGVEEPFLDSTLGWRVDGTEWKVRLDYGVGAVNWRSAFYNPGA